MIHAGDVLHFDRRRLLACTAELSEAVRVMRRHLHVERPLKNQERLMFARCGITDPLSIEEYRAHGGYRGLDKALAMQPAEIVAEVTESGLRGRGGAGFPTGIKWKTVMGAQADRKYIVCNADEGDSGTFADRMLMEGDPFLLLEGMAIAGFATGATYPTYCEPPEHGKQSCKSPSSEPEPSGAIMAACCCGPDTM